MGLEDLSMFRAVPNATVFYPSDAVATEKAVEIAANTKVCIREFEPENNILSVLSCCCWHVFSISLST